MIELRSDAELAAMGEAGQVVGIALARMREAAAVGVSLLDLDAVARDVIRDRGARSTFLGYHPRFAPTPFPAVICASVNDAVLHGIPDSSRLRDGDVVSLDVGAEVGGWAGDGAITVIVGSPRPGDAALVETTERALAAGVAAAIEGARLGDISHAIGRVARDAGYGLHTDFGGHGIGHTMHEEPSVPNDGSPGRGIQIRHGLVVAIEPWFMAGGQDAYRIDRDGWTIRSADGSRTAHFEHTVAVTRDGPRILTAP